jgi:mannose-6-phosphate isomerase
VDPRFLQPLALAPNPVYRFYQGGELLGRFRGDPAARDTDHPEDWVGSVTPAANPPQHSRPDEGLSVIEGDGDRVLLATLLAHDPVAVGGAALVERFGATTGVLVKLLDAGRRLPIHAHPTRTFARQHLASPFGKAEAWIVLETRMVAGEEPPSIRLGFREGIGRQQLLDLIADQRVEELAAAMHHLPVQAGDVIFVPPGTPHAIGAGALVMEIQEPTDFSILLEWEGFPIDPADADLGLGWETVIDTLDLGPLSAERLAAIRPAPQLVAQTATARLDSLLGPVADEFFGAYRLRTGGLAGWPIEACYSVGIVTDGQGRLANGYGTLDVARGSTFAILAATEGVIVQGDLDVVIFVGEGGLDPDLAARRLAAAT